MIGVIITFFIISIAAAQEQAPAPQVPVPSPQPAEAVPGPTPPPNAPAPNAPPPAGANAPAIGSPGAGGPAQSSVPGGNVPPAATGPGAPPASGTEQPPPAVLAPVGNGPALPSLSTPATAKEKSDAAKAPKATFKDIEANASLRNKSPFMIPTDLYLRIKRRQGEKVVENVIDDNISPKVRWPIRSYTLIGVLTGVKVPKALIQDKDGKIHTFRSKEFIANSGGYISEIGNGEVIVVERGAEFKLSLKQELKK